MKDKLYKNLEKMFVEIFNFIGLIGLSVFCVLGGIFYGVYMGFHIIEAVAYSCTFTLLFLIFTKVTRMI